MITFLKILLPTKYKILFYLNLSSALQSFLFVMLFSEKSGQLRKNILNSSQLLDVLSFYYHISSIAKTVGNQAGCLKHTGEC